MKKIIPAVALVALALTACGSAATDEAASPTTEATEASPATTEAPATTAAPTTQAPTTTAAEPEWVPDPSDPLNDGVLSADEWEAAYVTAYSQSYLIQEAGMTSRDLRDTLAGSDILGVEGLNTVFGDGTIFSLMSKRGFEDWADVETTFRSVAEAGWPDAGESQPAIVESATAMMLTSMAYMARDAVAAMGGPVFDVAPPAVQYTPSQEQAIKKAESYLSHMAFSAAGLVDQLEYEGFSTDDANFAVFMIDADWMKQAELKAASYLNSSSFSCSGLIDQLEYEEFTTDEARHGAESTGIC
jgi:hypothetical protein